MGHWSTVDATAEPWPAAHGRLSMPVHAYLWFATPGKWEPMPNKAHVLVVIAGRLLVRGGQARATLGMHQAAIIERPGQVEIRAATQTALFAFELPGPPGGKDAARMAPFRTRELPVQVAGAVYRAMATTPPSHTPAETHDAVARALGVVLMTPPQLAGGRRLGESSEVISEVTRLIVDEPDFAWTVGRLAERLGMSRRLLHELFSAEAGVNLGQVLREHRVYIIADLMATGVFSVQEAARAAGLASARAARELFKRQWGMTIGQYLKEIDQITHEDHRPGTS